MTEDIIGALLCCYMLTCLAAGEQDPTTDQEHPSLGPGAARVLLPPDLTKML